VRTSGACASSARSAAYGYYDAVDFTPQRVPEGTDLRVVLQLHGPPSGMSIVALPTRIFNGRMRDRFHSDPVIEAAELLLQEKAPRDIPTATVRTEADERSKDETAVDSPDTRHRAQPDARTAFDQS
jgi:cyclic beta-1,2-glucan synthetase